MTKRNLRASIAIDAQPSEVWSVVSDLGRMPDWSPQCRRMQLLGKLREGARTVNLNRRGRKFWPTMSRIVRCEPDRAIAFRTVTNNSTWSFEITPTATGSMLTEERTVPPEGTTWMSRTTVAHFLGGEDAFDDEMAEGMNTTLTRIKAATEAPGPPE